MGDLHAAIESQLTELRILIDRAYYIMQDVEEDYFLNADWAKDKAQWSCLAYMFPRAAAKSGAVADYIDEIRKTLEQIENAVKVCTTSAQQKGGDAA